MTQEHAPHPTHRFGHSLVYWLGAAFFRLFFRFYLPLRVVGSEHIPRMGGVLFAANHASYLDPPLTATALYHFRKPWIIGNSEMWRKPLFGYIVSGLRAYPVQRGTPDRAAIRQILAWLAAGEAVLIFPEGERTRDGTLKSAKSGVGLLALRSGVPVVPMALMGTYAAWPPGGKLRRGRITVAFGPPLAFAPGLSREEVAAQIMTAIADLLASHSQADT